MELGVGSILEGKVTGITKFGAFISLDNNKSGLVHISEIANSYVNDIHEHLQEGQTVKVKVIAIDDTGRINLSIKRALPPEPQNNPRNSGGFAPRNAGYAPRPPAPRGGNNGGGRSFTPRAAQPAAPQTPQDMFEAKLKQFMSDSEGKISDLNHYMDKRGGGRKRK